MRWRAPLALLVLALGTLPAVPPAAAEPEPDFIAVNARGAVPVEHDGGTFVWTADLFSLTTFEKIGTFTDRATCSTSAPPPCLIYDITTTYRVPGGEVTSRGLWSLAPDSTRPGFDPYAPVKAPFSYPNSSLSNSVPGIAGQFTFTKGPSLQGDRL